MARASVDSPAKLSGLASRLAAFITERHPFAVALVLDVFDAVGGGKLKPRDHAAIDGLRTPFKRELARRLYDTLKAPEGTDAPTPGTSAVKRMEQARAELADAIDGFLRREAIAASLTKTERVEILKGMVLTRAVDNRLKQFFMAGEVRWGDKAFQGKGFRSLGQEAIYAGGIRLKRGPKYRGADGSWRGDLVAPVIRDIGIALAMRHDNEAVRNVFTAQMGKDGPPMHGKDLHTGDFAWGVLPATAPLAIGALSASGLAMAFAREGGDRVAVTFIGEGGSSLGEWHEAINLCAVRKLPAIFCLQNNQTALSTPVADNSAVRVFADKAAGYGVPGVSVDGTDPEAIAAAFTWAAERARAGQGPTLIEVIAMRMCGHAHHDDMLYLGKDPQPSWDYHTLHEGGYADRELYDFWSKRDPLPRYAAKLESEGVINHTELDRLKMWARELVEVEAQAVIAMPWPQAEMAGVGVFADEAPRTRIELLDP
jgi:TPP-dependent pyruvate/acetoin dehydrogenase alpha subunit